MTKPNSEKQKNFKLIAQNRRARYDYFIEETIEAGVLLTGTEVKSIRLGRISLNEAYAADMQGEIFLLNVFIDIYPHAHKLTNHEPRRPRKLLFKKREIKRMLGQIQQKGVTLVPISMYFNHRGKVKIKIGLATGKKQFDKRATIKEREWKKSKERLLKQKV